MLEGLTCRNRRRYPYGSYRSLNNQKASCYQQLEVPQSETCKRQRTSSRFWDENPRLIPNLPDELSIQILARMPRISHFNAKLVSRSWKAALTSTEYYKVRKELGTKEEWLYVLTKLDGGKLVWHALDPVSRMWQRLPLMPGVVAEGEVRRGTSSFRLWNIVSPNGSAGSWLGRRDALEKIPFCGCAIGALDGYLYVLGGFCRTTAMKSVWRYDPIVNAWAEMAPMSTGRAYCKTGVLNNKLYAVGGVACGQRGLTPLQSAEVFDPCSGTWSEVPSMPFSKTQLLPTEFLANLLKPIATGMTSYKGKLYVPQSSYYWPFLVDLGGEVYDPETNSWVEMPVGMGNGWPAKKAGTKLSVIVDGELYALDPSSSFHSAKIKVYNEQDDAWRMVDEAVPIGDLAYSESPYLLASFHGKLHLITKDTNCNISVMQADWRNRHHPAPSGAIAEALHEPSANSTASSSNVWRVTATRNAGSAELISCQVLDI